MPVFTAFGWAGEANAIKFALEHLDLFIKTIYSNLSPQAKAALPFWGMNQEAQTVYLATNADPERGPYIAFYARPMLFEMRISITDKAAINRGLKTAEKSINSWHHIITELGEDWHLHLQQNHIDEESGEVSFYNDLYKDGVEKFDPESCETITGRAAFLNSEVKWITPVHLSYRLDSQLAAGMSNKLINLVIEQIDKSLPFLKVFARQQKGSLTSIGKSKSTTRTKKRGVTKKVTNKSEEEIKKAKGSKAAAEAPQPEEFSYTASLKKLHLRKGFINMTSKHWPFFAKTARTETREVSVYYDGKYDEKSTVWRLQPDNVARLVLGDESHRWLEDNFSTDARIQLQVVRLEGDKIQIRLQAA